jgi:hypothetical protein
MLSYITGFFDADGYVTLIKSSKKDTSKTPVIGFTNTQCVILETIQTCLKTDFQLTGHISTKKVAKENHAVGYDLKYTGTAALKLAELIFTLSLHPKKMHRLSLLICCYKNVVPRNGKYTEKKLKDLELYQLSFFQKN